MDRQIMKALEDVAINAVNQYCEEYDLPIVASFNGGSFAPEYGKFSIICASKDEKTGHVLDDDAVSLNQWGKLMGLGDLVGLPITVSFEHYELLGYKPRSTKYPFVAKRLLDGKVYKLGTSASAVIKGTAKLRLAQ